MPALIDKPWIRTTIIMLSGLVPGFLLFYFNIVGISFSYFPGDLGDGRLNLYFLEHAHKWFTGQLQSLWNAPFMYPEKDVLSYSDNLLGSAPIYSIFRSMGFDNFKSYQLWFLAVSSLNYLTAFYFLKYVFKNNYAAVLGAFVFAFSIALQSQLPHAQTFPRFAIPLAFLMAVKFGEGLKPKYFYFTLFFVVYQIYCGIYLGLMLAVPIGIYLVLIAVKNIPHKKQMFFNLKWFSPIILFTVINLALILPLMLPYMERKITPHYEHYLLVSETIPSITSHFFSPGNSFIWGFLSEIGVEMPAWPDHQIFAGGIATACVIIGMYFLVLQFVRSSCRLHSFSVPLILIFTGLITFILFIRFESISAYITLYFIPGFSSLRSLTRIINIELIFFGISTAFVFSSVMKKNLRYRHLIFVTALLLLIADNYFYKDQTPKTAVNLSRQRTQPLEMAFAEIPSGSVVSYEPSQIKSSSIYYHIDAMLTAQKYGLRTLNGYTATCPWDFGKFWARPFEDSRYYWLSDKKVDADSLYIVKDSVVDEKLSFKDIHDQALYIHEEVRLEGIKNYIRKNKEWMEQIEEKASMNNISVDSMLILDAIWTLEQEGSNKY